MKHFEILNDFVTSKVNKILGEKNDCYDLWGLVWLRFFCRQALTLERGRIPSSLLAAHNPRDCETSFCSRLICSTAGRLLRATVWALVLARALGAAHSHSKLQGETALHPGRPCTFKVSCMLLGPFCLQWNDGEDTSMEGPRVLTGRSWDIPVPLYHPEQNCSGFTASGAPLVFKFACKTHSSALTQFWFHV